MRYLILLLLIFFLISGKVYSKKTTCRELLKNKMTLGMTQLFFWSTYRGYIFGKTGEKIDNPDKVVLKRIPEYIKRECKENKYISVDDELLFKGLEDDFKKGKLTINFFLLHVDKEFKKDKVMKCSIENLNIDTIKLIEEKLPELEKLRESSGRSRYGSSITKKVFGKSMGELLNFKNLQEKCEQYM